MNIMKRNFCIFICFCFCFFVFLVIGCGSGGDDVDVNKSGTAAVIITSATKTIGDRITGSFNVADADSDNPSAVFTTALTPSGFSMLQLQAEEGNQRRKVAECWPVDELVRDDEAPLFWGFIPSQTGNYQFVGYISDGKGGETDFEFTVQVEGFSIWCDLYSGENEDAEYVLRIFPNSSSPVNFRIYWFKGDVPEGQITAGDFVAEEYTATEYNLGRLLEKQDYSCKVVAYNNPDQFGENIFAKYYKKFTTVSFNRPPIVELGAGFEMQVGQSKALGAVSAYDPDGDSLLGYKWECDGDGGTFDSVSSADPNFTATKVGEFVIKLTLTDPEGAYASDTVAITITTAPAPDPNTVLRDPNNYQVFPTFVVGYDFVIKKTEGEIVARNLPAIFSADAQAHFTTSPLAFVGDCNEWDPNQSDYLQIGADGTVVVKISDHDTTPGTKGFNFALINEGSAWDWALWYNMKPADVKMLIRPRNDGSVSFGYILLSDGSINMVAEGAATN